MDEKNLKTATFAGGCFWCLDALYRKVRGVTDVKSGFAGGEGDIDYSTIHFQNRGYAEAIHVTYDPAQISFEDLLDIFWHMHDPTQVNGQGPDRGAEYRSVVFYENDAEKEIIEKSKSELEKSSEYKNPIVTEILPFTGFVEADEDHQNFYNKNKMHPYCMVMIDPKIAKLKEKYFAKLK